MMKHNENAPPDVNPYEACDVDERPVEMAIFFRAEPSPRKITSVLLWEATTSAYSFNKGTYIAVGFAQSFFLFPLIAVVAAIVYYRDFVESRWDVVGMIAIVACVLLLGVVFYVVSISVILRKLRKENMIFSPSIREFFHLVWVASQCVLFLLTFVFVILLATIVLLPGSLILDKIQINDPDYPFLILGVLVYLLGVLIWIAILCLFYMRSALGLHCIIDRGVNFISAYRMAWRLTRGNLRALATGTPATSKPFTTFMILTLTCGIAFLPLIGYYFCWLTVSYLMLSGQAETIPQQPDEW
ncbi:MAG: hypothetical protein LBT05_12100 [Planctomycetaceae bacterium]|jgi:hypothetical protein|nr:hypothetical protein [Planctomycetaceae bacterium]